MDLLEHWRGSCIVCAEQQADMGWKRYYTKLFCIVLYSKSSSSFLLEAYSKLACALMPSLAPSSQLRCITAESAYVQLVSMQVCLW